MTHEELLKKAKQAQCPEALLALAKEHGVPMDEESAAAYFAQLHKTGELADEELDSVSGGGCHHDGKLIVTVGYTCEHWTCKKCGVSGDYDAYGYHACAQDNGSRQEAHCNTCKCCKYEDALWLCYHPAKRE